MGKIRQDGIPCPECGRKTVVAVTTMRRNYPFGKKSKPRYVPKKREEMCMNQKITKQGDGKISVKTMCRYSREIRNPPVSLLQRKKEGGEDEGKSFVRYRKRNRN